ncbi:MAG: tripartite tricarboxylate transporter substrate binding protein [Betaproteobacteria bacterium]|nr:tripartite tricarboxylate transporter substrate binding protein [Betaproteobacteria bacterium]
MTRRPVVARWIVLAVAMVAHGAWAQSWPKKAVRIVVPFAPGALTDIAARAIGAELGEQLGHQFIVENKGGAGGTLGTADVAKSPADGSSFVFTDNSYMISAGLYSKLPYDPVKDLLPVTLAVEAAAIMIARHDLPAKNVSELVALAKAKPRTLTYGSGGQGSSAHLATELFLAQAGVEMVHVPFKGVAAAIADVVGGRIDVTISTVGAALGQVKSGKARALAVTGKERVPSLPDVPTFAESGYPDYDMVYRFGFLAPARTPPAIVNRMRDEVAKAAAKPRVRELLIPQGARPVASTPAEYGAIIEREMRTWKAVIEKAGVKVE